MMFQKTMFVLVLVVCLALLLPGFVLAQFQMIPDITDEELASVKEQSTLTENLFTGAAQGQINWEKGYVIVSAYGAPDRKQVFNIADEKVRAIDLAYYNAIMKIAQILIGVRITGQILVEDFYKESSLVKAEVDGFVKGLQRLDKHDDFEEMPDGSILAKATVIAPLYGGKGFMTRLLDISDVNKKLDSFPGKKYTSPTKPDVPVEAPANITGLILDCRDMVRKPKPAVMPRLVTPDGRSVYGKDNVPRSVFVNGELFGYSGSIDSQTAKKKAGNNPLVIKPIGIDSNRSDDIVISQEDANRIILADRQQSFLAAARVLTVL